MQTGTLEIEDFYPYDFKFRYGGLMPYHEGIDQILAQGLERYEKELKAFAPFTEQFLAFSRAFDPEQPAEPCWLKPELNSPVSSAARLGVQSG